MNLLYAGRSSFMGIYSQISMTKLPRYLHTLFASVDANFRMRRKDVSSDEADPGLSKGWAYFVEDSGYKAHIKQHANDTVPVCQTLSKYTIDADPNFLEKHMFPSRRGKPG